jgi:uncharacterized protein (DUF1330 family)
MSAYAFAHLRSVDVNDGILAYLRRIDDTLVPYGGEFLVHGSVPNVVDGDLPGFIVIIRFPDLDRARAWYESPAYQEIIPLRLDNSDGAAAILRGVPDGYRAAEYADKIDPNA